MSLPERRSKLTLVPSLPRRFPFRIRKRKARLVLPAAICKRGALGGCCRFGHLPLGRVWPGSQGPGAGGVGGWAVRYKVLSGDIPTQSVAPRTLPRKRAGGQGRGHWRPISILRFALSLCSPRPSRADQRFGAPPGPRRASGREPQNV